MFISQQACKLLKENYKPQLDENPTPAIQKLFSLFENKDGVICLDFKYKELGDGEFFSYYTQFLLTKEGFEFIGNLYDELMNHVEDSHNLILMVERSYSVRVGFKETVIYDQPSDVFILVYTSANVKFNEENPFNNQYFDKLLNAVNATNELSCEMNEANVLINKLKGN